ncbi:hypothetical protein GF325_10175 [Candidatus Bathyarchaeota archaeon]|nr:hypothetical protein [Candidatus Bathyarchaeota archaeon]
MSNNNSIFARIGRALAKASGAPGYRTNLKELKAVPEVEKRYVPDIDVLMDEDCVYCGNEAVAKCRECGKPVCQNHVDATLTCDACRQRIPNKNNMKSQNVKSLIYCILFMVISIVITFFFGM